MPIFKEPLELGTGSALEPGLAIVAAPPSAKNQDKKVFQFLSLTQTQPKKIHHHNLYYCQHYKRKAKVVLKIKIYFVSSLSAPAAAAAEPVAPIQQQGEEQGEE